MFTRQHYIATAKIITKTRSKSMRRTMAARWIKMFRKDNKRFNKDTFLVACKLKKATKKKSKKKR